VQKVTTDESPLSENDHQNRGEAVAGVLCDIKIGGYKPRLDGPSDEAHDALAGGWSVGS
jgi:hypothetical protein